MPLWSLTQERVEKLRRQIGEIEMEVDTLIKLSKEDLWKKDLDLFIDEWRAQLDEEHKRNRRINNMGRRASKIVKVTASGPGTKKRKGLGDYDDDDFEDRPKAKRPAPPKVKRTEIIVEKKQNTLTGFFAGNGTKGKNPARNNDGSSSDIEPEQDLVVSTAADAKNMKSADAKNTKPAAKVKTAPVSDQSDEADIVKKPVARKARAAAAKPIHYGGGESESDDSNGDDLLGDITNMVKGLPGGGTKPSTEKTSLFSSSRTIPSSSTSLKPTAPPITRNYAEISDDDDTNFMALAPQQSPRRSIHVTKNAQLTDDEAEDEDDIRPLTTNKTRPRATTKPPKPAAAEKTKPVLKSETDTEGDNDIKPVDGEDDDDDVLITKTKSKSRPATAKPKASKPTTTAKPAAPPAAKKAAGPKNPKPATATATAAKKAAQAPTPLSPAAKAYAAKQAKNNSKKSKLPNSDDDDEADGDDAMDIDMDIDGMADDLLDSPVAASTGVGAASELEDSPPVVKKKSAAVAPAATSGRPARRAVVEAKKKRPVYVVSSDEDEDEGEDGEDGSDGGDSDGVDGESDEDF
jgi:DNA topoisomerase II